MKVTDTPDGDDASWIPPNPRWPGWSRSPTGLVCWPGNPAREACNLTYRVPVESRKGRQRAQIPLLSGPSGNFGLESPRPDLEPLNGSLWTKVPTEETTVYDLGVAGEEALLIEWRDQGGELVAAKEAEAAKEFTESASRARRILPSSTPTAVARTLPSLNCRFRGRKNSGCGCQPTRD
ncbi:MAG: hypothetical protein KJ070_02100 [Verrucomicrobia bacterium]|nr:hypothetical protein [Verrucomicrobiota bacterium]